MQLFLFRIRFCLQAMQSTWYPECFCCEMCGKVNFDIFCRNCNLSPRGNTILTVFARFVQMHCDNCDFLLQELADLGFIKNQGRALCHECNAKVKHQNNIFSCFYTSLIWGDSTFFLLSDFKVYLSGKGGWTREAHVPEVPFHHRYNFTLTFCHYSIIGTISLSLSVIIPS